MADSPGANLHLDLRPPAHIEELGERWVEVVGDEEEIKAKYQAILMYRSQIPPLGRFLTSFVRKNELFALARSYEIDRVPPGTLLIGGDGSEWPGKPASADPARDSVTRQVERAGDIISIHPRTDGRHLLLRLETSGRVASDVEYRVSFSDCPRSRRLVLRLKPPHRVMEVRGKNNHLTRDVVSRAIDNRLELAIPGAMLGFPQRLFLGVETRTRGIAVDRTGIHLLHLPAWVGEGGDPAHDVLYAAATPADLAACAGIFAASFRESIIHVFKDMPSQRLIQEVFRLCLDAEPSALWLDRGGKGRRVRLRPFLVEARVEGRLDAAALAALGGGVAAREVWRGPRPAESAPPRQVSLPSLLRRPGDGSGGEDLVDRRRARDAGAGDRLPPRPPCPRPLPQTGR